MYEALALVELAVWLGLPAWIANSTPVIFGGGRPIDGGRVFRDGRRILGDGKTVRGLIVGIMLGTLTGLVQSIVAPYLQPILAQFVTVTSDMQYVLYMNLPAAFLLSVGALLGDLIGSFLKRGFIILALVLAVPFLQPSPEYPIILILITLGIHWISNALGYLLGLKKNPW
ncbi:MAG: CDP-archaeol synthase [Candidatus Thorarchaeota archaeon]|jgi:CDP-2,3-bis-(O-geranylgeranyl)-sn-glycerol synthase